MITEKKIYECICNESCHSMVVIYWYDSEDDWEEFYFEIQAHSENGFFKRLWMGIKYAFDPLQGCFWTGTSLDRQEATKLRKDLGEKLNDIQKRLLQKSTGTDTKA
jgi:hypothetical protein